MKKQTYSLVLGLFVSLGTLQAQRYSDADVLFTEAQLTSICEGTELDGSQMVRAYGAGKTKRDAKKQLEKNAIRDVLFFGIREGKQGCEVRPLIPTPNARDKHKKYFNKFFSDGGQYKRYVKLNDSPRHTTQKYRGEGKEKIFTKIVTINMVKLERELTQEKIIPKPEKDRRRKPKKTN